MDDRGALTSRLVLAVRRTRFAGVVRAVRAGGRRVGGRLGIPVFVESVLLEVNKRVRREHPRVSVVIPSIGRDTLQRAVDSASWAHEVIVVFDAPTTPADRPSGATVLACGPSNHWGAEQRRLGIDRATGTHLAFMDDDDEYTTCAADVVPRALAARPGRVHIFGMRKGQHVYGGRGCVYDGGVGSPMFVVPNDGALGEWTTRRQGDFDFIRSTLARRRRRACFHDDVIAEIRPGGAR